MECVSYEKQWGSLSAAGSYDPDGDKIIYQWEFYKEPGSYNGVIAIDKAYASETDFTVPLDAEGKTIHIILSIHDMGEPQLYAFRRLIVTVGQETQTASRTD